MARNALFTIGEVVGVHGLDGKLKVRSFAESIETFKPGIKVKLVSSDRTYETWYEVLKSSPFKKGILLSLKGIEDINLAEPLKGNEILVKRDDLPEPEENTYFWQDLIGLRVLDQKQGVLGIIENIIQTGANDVFVVKGEKEILVPVIESVIVNVNIQEGTIVIDLPDGL